MEWNHHECTVSSHSHLNRRRLTGAVRVGEVFDRPALDPQRRRVGGEGRFQSRREAADGLLDPLRRRHVGLGQRHVLLRDVCTTRNKNTSVSGRFRAWHKAADRTERISSEQNRTFPAVCRREQRRLRYVGFRDQLPPVDFERSETDTEMGTLKKLSML